jgi:tetratricopeptide (TPR) repeat protein
MIALGEVTTSSPFILIRSVGDLARRIGEELLHRSNEPFAVGAHHSPIPPDERQLPSPEILEESSLKEETPPPEGQETSNLDFIIDKLIEQQETPTAEVEQRLENWFNLGLQKAQAGDLEGAIASWERLLEQAPHIAQAWHNRGSALAYLDRLEEAIASFERAIALNGNDYQSWNDRGNALYNLQRWEEALTSWDRVVSIKPDHYQAWYNRGLALEKLKLRPEALESYERALAIEPKFNLAQNRKNKLLANHEPSLERSNPSHEC